jgi:phosphatidylglycerol:prolipoprotein diacylglycerol transferase
LPVRRQPGDVAGLWLLGTGVAVYITELWRDTEGRGALLGGALDGPQAAAILMVLAGGLVLMGANRLHNQIARPPMAE